jgi:hypothetical protein
MDPYIIAPGHPSRPLPVRGEADGFNAAMHCRNSLL